MFRNLALGQQLFFWALCLIVALMLGVALATPLQLTSLGIMGLLLLALSLPLFLRWHYSFLIFSFNSALVVFFLPGQPKLMLVLAFFTLLIALATRPFRRNQQHFIHVPQVAWSLIFITAVVFGTALLSGGIGARALGGEMWGGKRYLGIFGAVLAYFALTSQSIPRSKAVIYATLFFAAGITAVFSDLIYAAGPGFYFLFNFFTVDLAVRQAMSQSSFFRLEGIAVASLSLCYVTLLRYGVIGILNWRKPLRGLIFVVLLGTSLLGGFRSSLIIIILIATVQFFLEGGFKTRFFPILLAAGILIGGLLIGFADKLPITIQRSLSFLPIENLDPIAKMDAKGTLDWRLEMWEVLLPDVPQYLWLGKGFSFSGTDFTLTQMATQKGFFPAYEEVLISGNYHSGILTLIIPFGIWGVIGFVWFCVVSLRVLYFNYKMGDGSLKHINRFLLAFFIARLAYYVLVYGQFDLDLMLFTGVVGLSIALNRGICSKGKGMPENHVNQITSPSPLNVDSGTSCASP